MNTITTLLSFAAKATADAQPADSAATGWTKSFSNLPIEQVIDTLVSSAVDLVLKLLIAIVVFYAGKFVINKIYKSTKRILTHRQVDSSLTSFVLSLVKIVLLFILIIIVISILGIETSSFIALFASAGVAIGMALSGTLQNFAGGVLILLLKPYKVGDFIEFQGFTGTVKEIQIFSTILNTADNKWISIPNGGLSTGSINNYSKEDYRRVNWTVSIAYGDDFDAAKREIMRILNEDDRIVKQYIEDDRAARATADPAAPSTLPFFQKSGDKQNGISRIFRRKEKESDASETQTSQSAAIQKTDKAPFVALDALGASSVDITVRAWTPTSLYWDVFYSINERFYKELPAAGINFPFPQMDVHIAK